MLDAIFFDQDNTLVNTAVVADVAYRKSLGEEMYMKWREIVREVSKSKIPEERTFGFSLGKLLGQGDPRIEGIIKVYEEELRKVQLNLGVKEFFEGKKIARYYILSTEDFADQIEMKLGKFGLWPKFDMVVGSREVGVMKPDIRYVKLAWDKFGLDPKKCVYVGDNYEKDCLVGVEAGGKGIVWGKDIQDMRELGAMI